MKALILTALLALSACAPGGGSPAAGPVVSNQLDMSGTWKLSHLNCYDKNTKALTQDFTSFLGLTSKVIQISGNSLALTIQSTNCKSIRKGTATFLPTNYSLTGLTVSYANTPAEDADLGCVHSYNMPSGVTPTVYNEWPKVGMVIPDVVGGQYSLTKFGETPYLMFPTKYTNGPNQDLCFEAYLKQ